MQRVQICTFSGRKVCFSRFPHCSPAALQIPPIGDLSARLLVCSPPTTARVRGICICNFSSHVSLGRGVDIPVAPGALFHWNDCRFGRLMCGALVCRSLGCVAEPNRAHDGGRPVEPVGVDPYVPFSSRGKIGWCRQRLVELCQDVTYLLRCLRCAPQRQPHLARAPSHAHKVGKYRDPAAEFMAIGDNQKVAHGGLPGYSLKNVLMHLHRIPDTL
jgi:hypothetical protein